METQITRREYFTALAMLGLVSNSTQDANGDVGRDSIAGEAVRMADELVKALAAIDEEK